MVRSSHKTLLIHISAAVVLTAACASETTTNPEPDPQPVDTGFVRVRGASLLDPSGAPFRLRGVNLSYDRVSESFCGGGEWRVADHTDWGHPVTCWYQEKHFTMLAGIGFNSVRVNLSYRIFEDNSNPGAWKQSGWDLVDSLVQWAGNNDLYLILDMHVASGGAGIVQCLGCGYRTWDDPQAQQRFVNLWREIARRYATEPRIAAYDLLNEPVPTQTASQWESLAGTLIDAIRGVDTNHVVVVEMVNWIFDRNDNSPLGNFDRNTLRSFQFLVNDANVLYDFHFYIPKAYTLQYETGIDGGTYPDNTVSETTFDGASMPRSAGFLGTQMDAVNTFWSSAGVPVNYGEWGTEGNPARGGDLYARDMLSQMDARSVNWQFYFMNRLYDISCCFSDNPTTVRSQELIDVFRTNLR